MPKKRIDDISWNPQFLTKNGLPWFPVMGEIHYSRVNPNRWETELLKMKSGGVELVSCYTIWIHHEEIENEWDFSGSRDLNAFLQTVDRCGLSCVLRIGPWAHGEVRNGGFPDWLVEREKQGKMVLRSDDPAYLAEVRKFYEKIYEQAKGFFLKDGGPIVGIQIENEYGHCGGQNGEAGEQHMRTLKQMAEEIGFSAPLWTATGWGGAVTGGMVPVMGGYCEAPWDPRTTEIEPSGNYIFTKERNDHNIGSDHGLGAGITFDMNQFPYLTAELGGGLQVTRHRRPVASAEDIGTMSMVKLGSGCNLLGYYMYHGGTNPKGKLTTLQESKETGYPNDLPVWSYDFNAPVKEYGQLSDTYREIRRLSMFVKDYEDILCHSSFVDQPGNPEKPENLEALRTSVRVVKDGEHAGSGFFFVNNYQRRYEMAEHPEAVLQAFDEQGTVLAAFPARDIRNGDHFFYPFGLKIGNAVLKQANVTPLCILHGCEDGVCGSCSASCGNTEGGNTYVFYCEEGVAPEYELEGDLGDARILTITAEEALYAQKVMLGGREHLLISEGDLIVRPNGAPELLYPIEGTVRPRFALWPDTSSMLVGFDRADLEVDADALERVKQGKISSDEEVELFAKRTASEDAHFLSSEDLAVYEFDEPLTNAVKAELTAEAEGRYRIRMTGLDEPCSYYLADEIYLNVDYEADCGILSCGNEEIADSFYTGQTWEIGIRQVIQSAKDHENCEGCGCCSDSEAEFAVSLTPLTPESKVYLQKWPEFENGKACRINGVSTKTVIRLRL